MGLKPTTVGCLTILLYRLSYTAKIGCGGGNRTHRFSAYETEETPFLHPRIIEVTLL